MLSSPAEKGYARLEFFRDTPEGRQRTEFSQEATFLKISATSNSYFANMEFLMTPGSTSLPLPAERVLAMLRAAYAAGRADKAAEISRALRES